MDTSALMRATAVGTVLQLGMVLGGHYSTAISQLFPVLGMTFSFVAGALYVRWAKRSTRRSAALGGAVAGAACAFLGIAVSFALGDVFASILALGTLSSAVTGMLGGLAGHWLLRPAESGSGYRSAPAGTD
jgi:xanthine/uracil permease